MGVTPGIPFRQFLALFNDIAAMHNESPSGSKNPISLDDIIQKVTGYSGDHAADQKKLARVFCNRKQEAVVRSYGKEVMLMKPSEEVEKVMTDKFLEVLNGMGGWVGWEELSLEDQVEILRHLVEDTRCHFGELDLAALPEHERRLKLLFVQSWCAMHKDRC